MPETKILRFFLGANSAQGFVSRFDQLGDPRDGWRLTILKGGPGTGKSTLMRAVSAQLAPYCPVVEEIHCTSDVDSLDGVLFPAYRLSIADGTAPHTLDPKYPGACETIANLSSCWKEEVLFEHREKVMALIDRCSDLHRSASGYLYAAGSLLTEVQLMAREATDEQKVRRLARSIAAREFPKSTGKAGRERIRFLSGITDKGPMLFEDTAQALASRIQLVEDPWGVSAPLLLSELRQLALGCGLELVTCPCPLFPFGRIDHLFLPELSLGFMIVNRFHPVSLTPERTIHARRFTDLELIRSRKRRIAFLLRAAENMIQQSAGLLANAKEEHDRLEQYYIAAMDRQAQQELTKQVASRLEGLIPQNE